MTAIRSRLAELKNANVDLGLPVTAETPFGGAGHTYQQFANGYILADPDGTTWPITGPIATRYAAVGGPAQQGWLTEQHQRVGGGETAAFQSGNCHMYAPDGAQGAFALFDPG
jgi:uncharacterized protein with LGFP repeats